MAISVRSIGFGETDYDHRYDVMFEYLQATGQDTTDIDLSDFLTYITAVLYNLIQNQADESQIDLKGWSLDRSQAIPSPKSVVVEWGGAYEDEAREQVTVQVFGSYVGTVDPDKESRAVMKEVYLKLNEREDTWMGTVAPTRKGRFGREINQSRDLWWSEIEVREA